MPIRRWKYDFMFLTFETTSLAVAPPNKHQLQLLFGNEISRWNNKNENEKPIYRWPNARNMKRFTLNCMKWFSGKMPFTGHWECRQSMEMSRAMSLILNSSINRRIEWNRFVAPQRNSECMTTVFVIVYHHRRHHKFLQISNGNVDSLHPLFMSSCAFVQLEFEIQTFLIWHVIRYFFVCVLRCIVICT